MGKKRPNEETKEERRERKRQKKERRKKNRSGIDKDDGTDQQQEGTEGCEIVGPIRQTKMEMMVSLTPRDLVDVQRSLQSSIRKLLLRYNEGVGGVLLAFEKLKILRRGEILNELPHIHYVVSVTGTVFSPKQGQTLSGVVYECFHSHISVLLLGYFNASIAATELQGCGFQFDARNTTWNALQNGSDVVLSKGKTVACECLKLFVSEGIISIEGKSPRIVNSNESPR